MKKIGISYKDLTEKQLNSIIEIVKKGKAYRFTTDEISKQEAISLCSKKGVFSAYLAKIVPEEYLDDQEFMQKFVSIIRPIHYDSVALYASNRLKQNLEFASFCIDKHGEFAISALAGGNAGLYDYSQVLLDKNFVLNEIKKIRMKKVFENGKSSEILSEDKANRILTAFVQYSPVIRDNKKLMIRSIKIDPYTYRFIDKSIANDEEVIMAVFESILENGQNYYLAKLIEEPTNKKLKKIRDLCLKISELPANAKTRNLIYRKLAKTMAVSATKSTKTEDSSLISNL